MLREGPTPPVREGEVGAGNGSIPPAYPAISASPGRRWRYCVLRDYPTIYSVADMLEGFATLKRLATLPPHVVPGHDPLVLRRYPAAKPRLEGVAVRLKTDSLDRS
jgi:hypothetical protein